MPITCLQLNRTKTKQRKTINMTATSNRTEKAPASMTYTPGVTRPIVPLTPLPSRSRVNRLGLTPPLRHLVYDRGTTGTRLQLSPRLRTSLKAWPNLRAIEGMTMIFISETIRRADMRMVRTDSK